MTPFQSDARTSVVFGAGALARLVSITRGLGFRRTLLVADQGMVAAGYAAEAARRLEEAGIAVTAFHDFTENPDSAQVEKGRGAAAAAGIDSLVGLGGGSSMDCAKGIDFLVSCGGRIEDYCGWDKAPRPLLPMIGIPTTTGTGSEAQSYALISDAETHVKMACGAPSAAFRTVILDPELARTQPRAVLAATGYDALSHAVETFVTSGRNFLSLCYSREAWRLLACNFERLLERPGDMEATAAMQMGAYLAGLAIENSMLGAAHACANPLTAECGITHGVAIALMLAHVVRWNGAERYAELEADLPARLDTLARRAGLPRTLREAGVVETLLPKLAEDASKQWTGRFNPRPLDAAAALEIYRCAY
ncbi:MAG: iron-containing alcohol dehydrogenase [Acidimicrobiia bacterium]|nr:iron-containing alcohol dehydrogenase [Acidimicrobiia bacterium]